MHDLLELRALEHRRVRAPFAPREPLLERIAQVGRIVGDQAGRIAAPGAAHLACSTLLSLYVAADPVVGAAFFGAVEARCGRRPSAFVQSYQCASWGFALRAAAGAMRRRELVVSIVDVDVHNTHPDLAHPVIGRCGFGITTLHLRAPGQALLPRCDGAPVHAVFSDLMHALRGWQREHGRHRCYLPFFPDGRIAALAAQLVGADVLAPNLHADYGHCFGSDPWIGLVEDLRAGRCRGGDVVTVGALAYGGYFTLCNVRLDEAVDFRLDDPQAHDPGSASE